jgi:hypothetical protein
LTYLDELRNAAAQAAQSHRAPPPPVDLDRQIQALMDALPDAVRNRPWSLSELVPRLRGKYNDRPAQRDIAAALHRLGWVQQRRWTRAARNCRVWLPPRAN